MEQAIIYRCTGEGFEPSTNYQAHLHGQRYMEGQLVPLVEFSQRSDKSHDHYFATLHNMWLSLPEELSKDFPNEEILRSHALIRTGYCNKRQLVCRSAKEAIRAATFMQPSQPMSIIEADGCVVTEWAPESQAYRAMGKQRFQESKDAVLGYVNGLLERQELAA